MAHRFLNYLLQPDVALKNFVEYAGYQPPITKIDADAPVRAAGAAGEPAQLRGHARGLRDTATRTRR